MERILAMIPARLGSKRVRHKNLRLLDGRPLVRHVAETARKAGVFDAIYINSEADDFRRIAKESGVQFYKRPPALASDSATNDEFVLDFIRNRPCGIVIQINPTSPLLSVSDVRRFVAAMKVKRYDTLHSVKKEQIEALFEGGTLNFNPLGKMPRSQDLAPVYLFSSGIMGWRTRKYFENMEKYGSATYGGDGKTGYFTLEGFSTIDIDHEEDFLMAELALEHLKRRGQARPRYYDPGRPCRERVEVDVPTILRRDGVRKTDMRGSNKAVVNLQRLIRGFGRVGSWSKRIINTESNSATLICQRPGEGNRLHYHKDWNEWWYIVDGMWKWEIDGEESLVRKGDVVFIRKNSLHRVTAVGRKPAIRLAVSREDVPHIYPGNR